MSTLRFRAWHKDQKTMLCPCNEENAITILEFYEEEGQIEYPSLNIQKEGWAIIRYTNDTEEKLVSSNSGVLMQSTGLKDKNGVEIFEGDILEHAEDKRTVLEVNYNGASFKIYPTFKDRLGNEYDGSVAPGCEPWDESWDYLDAGESFEKDFEVIGNIYQNPTLL